MSTRSDWLKLADSRSLPREKQLRLCAFLGLLAATVAMVEKGIRHGWTDPMIALAILGVPVLLVGILAPQIVRAWRHHMFTVYGDDGPPTRTRRK
jgi:hypothetical protein